MGWTPARKRNSTEIRSLSRKLSSLVINDHHSDSSYSSNKIILDNSTVFLDFKKPGTDNLDPDSSQVAREGGLYNIQWGE